LGRFAARKVDNYLALALILSDAAIRLHSAGFVWWVGAAIVREDLNDLVENPIGMPPGGDTETHWFRKGLESGQLSTCDTFGATNL
jgi:hypothetical protein